MIKTNGHFSVYQLSVTDAETILIASDTVVSSPPTFGFRPRFLLLVRAQ